MLPIGCIIFGVIAILCLLAIGLLLHYKPEHTATGVIVSALGFIFSVFAIGAAYKMHIDSTFNALSSLYNDDPKYDEIDIDDIIEYEKDIDEYKTREEAANNELLNIRKNQTEYSDEIAKYKQYLQDKLNAEILAAREKAKKILRNAGKSQFPLTPIHEDDHSQTVEKYKTQFRDELQKTGRVRY